MSRRRFKLGESKNGSLQTNSMSILPLPKMQSPEEHNKYIESKPPGKIFTVPITPSQALSHYSNFLSPGDDRDINRFRKIYFLRRMPDVYSNRPKRTVDYFPFLQYSHIKYQYEQLNVVGKGSFGIVIKCFDHKTKDIVAIKLVKDSRKDTQQIQIEKELLIRVSSSEINPEDHNILPLIESFSFRGYAAFVTKAGIYDIYSLLRKRHFIGFRGSVLQSYLKQIATSLEYVHTFNIIHSDVKPENIIVMDDLNKTLALTDFGCSSYDENPLYGKVQSLYYRAPEVVYEFLYGIEIDVWSFGCLAYELVTGQPLFNVNNEDHLISCITELCGEPPAEIVNLSERMKARFYGLPVNRVAANESKVKALKEILDPMQKGIAELIGHCLEWHPAQRYTMKDILNDPFFKAA